MLAGSRCWHFRRRYQAYAAIPAATKPGMPAPAIGPGIPTALGPANANSAKATTHMVAKVAIRKLFIISPLETISADDTKRRPQHPLQSNQECRRQLSGQERQQ